MKIEVEKGDLSYANEINMTLSFPESFTASDFNMFFTSIKAYRNKQILSLEVNKTAKEFLSFSRYLYFNLYEFCGIKSKYSKSVFRILIQFKNVKSNFKGEKELTLTKKQFRNLLSIPINFLKSSQILKL
ncbi:RepB family plasmid replication initiator protein [Campylobacter devanensis]|uniref:RepB family plasmid replication initiator protein n=1 Tax=Campylobacter devanensis TaxID=3161138 RepID=UPI000A35A07D|nr:RepB family plasmid replication initiator protein [Campylobacter sp. P0132]